MTTAPVFDAVAAFTVHLSWASDVPVSANWQTVDGTALAGVDYQASSGTVIFAPGELSQVIEVPCVTPSGSGARQFSVVLTAGAGAIINNGASTPAVMASQDMFKGDPGEPGAPGADGRTILSGTGAPAATLGKDGDFYIATDTATLYGPKAAGAWPAGISLKGAPGDPGEPGPTGSTILSGTGAPTAALGADGDFYVATDTSTFYGPKTAGTWPVGVALKGSPGIPGAPGAPGTGLTNRGNWAAGTSYDPGDYVFAPNSGGATSMFICNAAAALTSDTAPKDDNANWIEFSAPAGADGREVELQKGATAIQWRYVGDEDWVDLVAVADLAGTPGTPGADGRTILSGTGAPAATLGKDGDFYIATDATTLYGPKAAGAWPAGVSLKGAPGDPGPTGSTIRSGTGAPAAALGADGDFYVATDTTTFYGPKASGAWPAGVSLVGPPGTGSSGGGSSSNLLAVLAADTANQQTAIQELVNVPVTAGQGYVVRFYGMTRPSDATKGLTWGITGTCGPAQLHLAFRQRDNSGAPLSAVIGDKSHTITFASSEFASDGNLIVAEGLLTVSSTGTFGIGYAPVNQYDYQAVVRGTCLILEPIGAVSTS